MYRTADLLMPDTDARRGTRPVPAPRADEAIGARLTATLAALLPPAVAERLAVMVTDAVACYRDPAAGWLGHRLLAEDGIALAAPFDPHGLAALALGRANEALAELADPDPCD